MAEVVLLLILCPKTPCCVPGTWRRARSRPSGRKGAKKHPQTTWTLELAGGLRWSGGWGRGGQRSWRGLGVGGQPRGHPGAGAGSGLQLAPPGPSSEPMSSHQEDVCHRCREQDLHGHVQAVPAVQSAGEAPGSLPRTLPRQGSGRRLGGHAILGLLLTSCWRESGEAPGLRTPSPASDPIWVPAVGYRHPREKHPLWLEELEPSLKFGVSGCGPWCSRWV